MKNRIEAAIQKALVNWTMKSYGNQVRISASFNEHGRNHVAMGMDVGEPDLRFRVVKDNITYLLFLELKKQKGRLSESQIAWNLDFDLNWKTDNCQRDVAYGFREACEIVEEWMGQLNIEKCVQTKSQ